MKGQCRVSNERWPAIAAQVAIRLRSEPMPSQKKIEQRYKLSHRESALVMEAAAGMYNRWLLSHFGVPRAA